MSLSIFKRLEWCWKQPVKGPQKAVLQYLCCRASEEALECWPSLTRIANDCGMSRRSVIRAIEGLFEGGYIVKVEHRGSSNRYRLMAYSGETLLNEEGMPALSGYTD